MTETHQSADAPETPEPAIRMALRLSTENCAEDVAAVYVYLPDGVPPSVRKSLEDRCREMVRIVAENLLVGWSS